ncbi:MAG: dihydrofolate reductase family protein [Alphaproteobacteria bacterium]|nr:dihydrofolate reductase family protein [Alphaproteobacteria bacterium]
MPTITGHVFIATSLDGYIARDDGDIGWLHSIPTEGEDHGYQDFMARVDGLIMGRETFRKVLEFETWPYSKPVVVMSQSLRQEDVPSRLSETVHVSDQPPDPLMQSLSVKGWKRAYVDGGQVIQSFMKAGLIEDLIITRIPILLGRGRPLFGPLSRDVRLDHIKTTTFPSGLVQSTYRVRSNP